MNDRFKFRAWNKTAKIMKEVSQLNFSEEQMGNLPNDSSKCTVHLCWQPSMIIMQCTGLKDRNGKLIYEGDIVRTWKFSTGVTKLSVIVWNETRCGFRLCDIDNYRRGIYRYPQSMVNVTTIEALGNVYENPELLEGKNNEQF